jgi:hypothetical protein
VIEDVNHFLFTCPKYRNERIDLLNVLRQFYPLNVQLLLVGNKELSLENDNKIFLTVQHFIKVNKRFDFEIKPAQSQ